MLAISRNPYSSNSLYRGKNQCANEYYSGRAGSLTPKYAYVISPLKLFVSKCASVMLYDVQMYQAKMIPSAERS